MTHFRNLISYKFTFVHSTCSVKRLISLYIMATRDYQSTNLAVHYGY